MVATLASITACISTRFPSRKKSKSASGTSLRNSYYTSILSLAIPVAFFIFDVDEIDAVAPVLPGPAGSYTISRETTAVEIVR